MKKITVYIYWPNGNTTAVVDKSVPRELQSVIAQKILNKNLAEQVIFKEEPSNKKASARLQMMGNEFSGNATLVFGYYLIKNYGFNSKVIFESSGIDKLIKVSINQKQQVESKIPMNFNLKKIEQKDFYWTVPLSGIFQIIIPSIENKNIEKLKNQLIKKYQNKEKALGLMFVNKNEYLRINPFVWVKKTKTLINETACGSGSIATALWWFLTNNNQINNLPIIQPTNKKILVSLDIKDNTLKGASLKSRVKFLSKKTISLN